MEKRIPADAARRVDKAAFGHQGDFLELARDRRAFAIRERSIRVAIAKALRF
jgi:hypothetical protein